MSQKHVLTFCRYSIIRDHDTKTGFFIVFVPEADNYGLGFQLRTGPNKVWGISICTSKIEAKSVPVAQVDTASGKELRGIQVQFNPHARVKGAKK